MILVIGDTSEDLARWTLDKFGRGQLACTSNYSALGNDVYFTALGDLDFDKIKTLALSAEQVYFVENLPWTSNTVLTNTKILCNHISLFRPVLGFDTKHPELFLTQPVNRNYHEPTLWTFGCSHTAGVGLDNPENQVYGKLLADKLGMPWQNIAINGSSTRWSLAHLLQADLGPDDVVVWATTSAERTRIAGHSVEEVLLKDANKHTVQHYTDEQILFEHLDLVNTGVRYLRATKKKFVLLSLLKLSPYYDKIELHFSGHKEWCPVLDWFDHDRGNDGIHTGPVGHIKLAEHVNNHIQLLGYDKSIS